VSLKTNNHALASALQAEKERSDQLQVLNARKQADAMLFKRAMERVRHRRVVGVAYPLLGDSFVVDLVETFIFKICTFYSPQIVMLKELGATPCIS